LRPSRNSDTCSFRPLWGPWHLVRIFHEHPEDSQFFEDPLAINNCSCNPSCRSAFGHFCWTVVGIILQQEQVRRETPMKGDFSVFAYEWRRCAASEGCWVLGFGWWSRSQSVAVHLVLLHPFKKLRFPAPQLLLVDLPDIRLVANGSADHQHSTVGPHIVGVL
jgi:hypothetical protein